MFRVSPPTYQMFDSMSPPSVSPRQLQCVRPERPSSSKSNDLTAASSPTVARQRQRLCPNSFNCSNCFLDERVVTAVSKAADWNPFLLCFLSLVCKKLEAIVKRVLWRDFCFSRVPKMASDLLAGSRNGHIDGGWPALGKLLLYCAGCHATSNFDVPAAVAEHFVKKTRFSKTSGKSFLIPSCRSDVLYVTDLCEHEGGAEDVGLFRGVFRGFEKSKTRILLIERRVKLDEKEICPFCRAKVWSMTTANMIPNAASRRLAALDENVEYFICLNGHINGKCSLVPLSDSED